MQRDNVSRSDLEAGCQKWLLNVLTVIPASTLERAHDPGCRRVERPRPDDRFEPARECLASSGEVSDVWVSQMKTLRWKMPPVDDCLPEA